MSRAIPLVSQLQVSDLAVPLTRYAQMVNYAECAFWGVYNENDEDTACNRIWTQNQRDMVQHYLAESQYEIEQVTNYPLNVRWFTDEEHPYANPLFASYGRFISGGIQATSNIALLSVVDHTNDPAVVGPIATTVTDTDEVRVYHPGTDVEIYPSLVSISGGNLTIQIPRCRMVKTALVNNPDTGLMYTTIANFEATVDVKRVYNDPSDHGVAVWLKTCANGCEEDTGTICVYPYNQDVGIVTVQMASYSSGTWTPTCKGGCPVKARINYRAGMHPTSKQAEDAIIRLAHSKMPMEPCGCDIMRFVWTRDARVPDNPSRERLNCPFGMSDGAWIAWRFSQAMRVFRGGTL